MYLHVFVYINICKQKHLHFYEIDPSIEFSRSLAGSNTILYFIVIRRFAGARTLVTGFMLAQLPKSQHKMRESILSRKMGFIEIYLFLMH